jgi:hypothetical protein
MDKKPRITINTGMTIQLINTGTSANAGDGDSLRSAFSKINANFQYLSTATGATTGTGGSANLGDITVSTNIFSTINTNENIVFDPNGTGVVSLRNTVLQFDNGTGNNPGQGNQILQTRGSGSAVGLAIDSTNSSLRVVGDKQQLGTLIDFGLYTGALNSWDSKVLIDYQGNITAKGNIIAQSDIILTKNLNVNQNIITQGSVTATGIVSALSGIKFGDGSLLNTAVSALSIGLVTSSTTFSTFTNVSYLAFDTESGFDLTQLSAGKLKVGMNSTFKYWHVAGQDTLVAGGLDHITFIAGNGVTIATNTGTNPKSISFSATAVYGGALGDLSVDSTVIYSTSTIRTVGISNKNINLTTDGASYLSIPALADTVSPLIVSSPNEVRITTSRASNNPITISPNQDGNGPGYVVIGSSTSTSTGGLFAFSAVAGIDFWPNPSIVAQNYGNPDVGVLDLTTQNNNNISLRPNGTGTVIVTSLLKAKQGIVLGTSNPGAGAVTVNSSSYKLLATLLDITAPVHKLEAGNYYLPPGQEGQLVYFLPKTGVQFNNQPYIWFERVRLASTATAIATVIELQNQRWNPLIPSNPAGSGVSFAIYNDGAWSTHQSFLG